MSDRRGIYAAREDVEEVEEGKLLAPKFDKDGLIPVVTTDHTSGELLMHAYMNEEAFAKTIELKLISFFLSTFSMAKSERLSKPIRFASRLIPSLVSTTKFCIPLITCKFVAI